MRKIKMLIVLYLSFSTVLHAKDEITSSNSFLKMETGNKFIYRIMINEREYTETTEYHTIVIDNRPCYSYISIGDFTESDIYKSGGKHKWEVTTDIQGMPIKISFQAGKNTVEMEFDGDGTVHMKANWNEKILKDSEKFKSNVTSENSLLVRTLDFSHHGKYVFDLLQLKEMPYLEAYEMFFEVLGDETVTVKAGTFKCKRILFSLTGFKGFFYKAYYYVTNDECRYIVKIDNMPMEGSSELIRIE